MKKFFLLFLLLVFSGLQAQIDVEKLLTKRYLNCDDIFYNNADLIPEYHQKKAGDTLSALIRYWEQACGLNDKVFMTKKLWEIEKGISQGDEPDEITVTYLNDFIQNKRFFDNYYSNYLERGAYLPVNRLLHKTAQYYDFTKLWALHLLQKESLDKVSRLILMVYAGKADDLKEPARNLDIKLPETKYPHNVFNYQKTNTRNFLELDMMPGMWLPTGKMKLLGAHPLLDFRLGGLFLDSRSSVNLELSASFGDSKEAYMSVNGDTLMSTQSFSHLFVGLNVNYDLIARPKGQLYAGFGLGYSGLMTFDENESLQKDEKPVYINSLDFNLAMGYRYVISDRFLMALEAKYHMANYKNVCGTDLSGDYFVIGLIFGFLE